MGRPKPNMGLNELVHLHELPLQHGHLGRLYVLSEVKTRHKELSIKFGAPGVKAELAAKNPSLLKISVFWSQIIYLFPQWSCLLLPKHFLLCFYHTQHQIS